MMTENVQALVAYRLEQANESLEAARTLLDNELIRPSVNRAYYAMFYAVLALLAQGKKETSKHSGAIALFDRDFVKQGVFKKNYSRCLRFAATLRLCRRISRFPRRHRNNTEKCRFVCG